MTLTTILFLCETDEEVDAVENIFKLYYSAMVAKAMDILKNEKDAEDAAMNVIQKIAMNASNYLEYKSTQTVHRIICITQNEAIDIYRRNKRRNGIMVDIDELDDYTDYDEDSDIAKYFETQETYQLMMEAINELDEKYRVVIIMSYAHKMKNCDIADELGMDRSHVNVTIYRAKHMIKVKMLEKGYVT